MTDRYRHLAAAVDPAKAEALRQRLHTRLERVPATSSEPPAERDIQTTPDPNDTHQFREEEYPMSQLPTNQNRRRRWAIAAVALGAAATIAVISIVAATGDDGPGTSDTVPATASTTASVVAATGSPTTVAPTTLAPTTVAPTTTLPPLSDQEIADAVLLGSTEYGPGWDKVSYIEVTLDREVAAPVPGCAPYLDIAFESAARPASVAFRWFHKKTPAMEAAMSQYVVVFPDESAAEAMFDAVSSDDFLTNCMVGYLGRQPAAQFAALGPSNVEPPALDLAGDEVSLGRSIGELPNSGVPVQAQEDVLNARIRVGRVVITIEGGDPTMLTSEEFQAAVAKVVERARAALAGTPLPA